MKFKEWLKIREAEAIVSSCKGGPDFQVMGACSDLKKKKKMSGMGSPGTTKNLYGGGIPNTSGQ